MQKEKIEDFFKIGEIYKFNLPLISTYGRDGFINDVLKFWKHKDNSYMVEHVFSFSEPQFLLTYMHYIKDINVTKLSLFCIDENIMLITNINDNIFKSRHFKKIA